MKKLYLFFVLGLLLGEVRAQVFPIDTVDCSYNPWGGIGDWVTDAKKLALREIYIKQDSYKDTIQIPYSRYAPILEDLQAIYTAGSPYLTDSIFYRYQIHAVGPPNIDYVYFNVNTNYSWVQQWMAGNVLSGNDSVDAMMNTYGLIRDDIRLYSGAYGIYLYTTYPINVRPLGPVLSAINGILNVDVGDFNIYFGDWSNIIMNDSTTYREYIFKYGAGDCPSGCTIVHYWKFRVYLGCAVQYMGSWGTPLQHPTGITSISNPNSAFIIYPNPATSSVTVTVDESLLGSTATVTDITGRSVAAVQLQTTNNKLETANLANGIYLVTITGTNTNTATKRLIISH